MSNELDRPLRTVLMLNQPPYTTTCDLAKLISMNGSYCIDVGIYMRFFAFISTKLNITFQYVPAIFDGTNTSSMEMLRRGDIDFMAPTIVYNAERLSYALESAPIIYSQVMFYTARVLQSSDFNLLSFLGRVIFTLGMTSLVGIYLVHNFPKSKKPSSSARPVENLSTVVYFFVIAVVLNLFASKLSVEVVQQKIRTPKFADIGDFRKAVAAGLRLYIPIDVYLSYNIIYPKLFPPTISERLRKAMMQNIIRVPYDQIFQRIQQDPGAIAPLISLFVANSVEWLSSCDQNVAVVGSGELFDSTRGGFYFSRKRLAATEKLRSAVAQNLEMMRRFYYEENERYLKQQHKYWQCHDHRRKSSFEITLDGAWQMAFRYVLIVGLGIAVGVFVFEVFRSFNQKIDATGLC